MAAIRTGEFIGAVLGTLFESLGDQVPENVKPAVEELKKQATKPKHHRPEPSIETTGEDVSDA